MRILVLVFHFPPISGGGVVIITEIINKFKELGHDVTVITPELEWDGERYEPIIHPEIKIIRTQTPSKTNMKIAARRCQTEIKKVAMNLGVKEKYDFVFTIFHPFHLVPKAAVDTAKKLRIPCIVKIDDAVYEKSKGVKSIQRKVEKIINSKTLRNADYVLVSNNESKNIVKEYYKVSLKNLFIIPNGVNLKLFKISKRDTQNIIFTGAMYYHRGLDILLEAVPKIIKNFPNTKFILIGSGSELEKLKRICKINNLENYVEFTGWVNRNEIPKKLEHSILGIGPLRLTDVTKGALPIKVLEYMSSSLPIIAKNGTLPKEILEDGVNGFNIENSDELANKIIFLLNNKKAIDEMGDKSYEMVKKFSWDEVVKNIISLVS